VFDLYSSTCFEHYCAHLQGDNCINTASGIVTLFRWLFSTQVTRGLSTHTIGSQCLIYIPPHVSNTTVLIFRRTIVLIQHLVSSLSLGDCSVHRLLEDSILIQLDHSVWFHFPPQDCRLQIGILTYLLFCIFVISLTALSWSPWSFSARTTNFCSTESKAFV